MFSSTYDGVFIVLEGIDGSGKSSLALKLGGLLNIKYKKSVKFTAEPTDSEFGTIARNSIRSDKSDPLFEMYCFALDRYLHCKDTIFPALQRGEIIISDRYIYSTLAYQQLDIKGLMKKDEFYDENSLNMDALSLIYQINTFSITPDVVIFLDIEPKIALKRIENAKRTELSRFERLEYLQKIRQGYMLSFEKYPPKWMFWEKHDRPIDDIADSIIEALKKDGIL